MVGQLKYCHLNDVQTVSHCTNFQAVAKVMVYVIWITPTFKTSGCSSVFHQFICHFLRVYIQQCQLDLMMQCFHTAFWYDITCGRKYVCLLKNAYKTKYKMIHQNFIILCMGSPFLNTTLNCKNAIIYFSDILKIQVKLFCHQRKGWKR